MMAGCCDHRGPCLAALLALALTGCGDSVESSGSAEAQIRDSAGIRVVEYAGTPSVPTLTLAEAPLYTHGTGPDDYQFASIGNAVLYPDGSAAVFDWGNREIILLSPDGAFRNVLARQGDGPGEISQYGTITLTAGGADTLLVEDDWNMLLTLFAGGAVARIARPPMGDAVAGLSAKGIGDGGRILMASVARSGAPSDYRASDESWRSGHMVLYDLSTQVADTVARYDWNPVFEQGVLRAYGTLRQGRRRRWRIRLRAQRHAPTRVAASRWNGAPDHALGTGVAPDKRGDLGPLHRVHAELPVVGAEIVQGQDLHRVHAELPAHPPGSVRHRGMDRGDLGQVGLRPHPDLSLVRLDPGRRRRPGVA